MPRFLASVLTHFTRLIDSRQEQQLNFPLLSDFNKEVSTVYESLYQTFGLV